MGIIMAYFFGCQARALVNREVPSLVFATDDELPEPQELIDVARGAGVAQHRLAVEAEEDEYRRGAYAMFLEGEVLLRHLASAEVGQHRVAARVHVQQAEVLAVVILHHRLIEHRGLHLLAPRTVGVVEHHEYAKSALLLRERQFVLEIAEALFEEVCQGIA